MRCRTNGLVAAAAMLSLTTLAACSGADEGARSTLLSAPPTTPYVVVQPETTTTTTEVPITLATPVSDGSGTGQAATENPGTYTVQPNDSVFKIADRFGLEPEQLAQINGWSDGVSHTILPGQVISVAAPADTAGSQTATGTTPAGTEPTSGGADCPTTYTITSSDTSRIKVADRFGITWQELDAANGGTPGYESFLVGAVINIPCPA